MESIRTFCVGQGSSTDHEVSQVFPFTIYVIYVRLTFVSNAVQRTHAADPHFFALSVYALETSLEHQYNCYTIMALERAVRDKLPTMNTDTSDSLQATAKSGRDFILWKNKT